MVKKTCSSCKEEKPAEQFCKNKTRPDGLAHWCRACLGRERGKYYQLEKNTETYRLRHIKSQAKYIAKNREVSKAHLAARLNKDVIKKSECENCGVAEKLHMHHPDYSKPLEVVTLCVPCHEVAHHGAIV